MSDGLLISGPTNTIRLEGIVNGIKKHIYIFGDIHKDILEQTKCNSFESDDIVKYIVKTIKNAKKNNPEKIVDFFVESLDKNRIQKSDNTDFTMSYIDDVRNLYENINITTNTNLRLHYIDFREFSSTMVFYQQNSIINTVLNKYIYYGYYTDDVFKKYKDALQKVKKELIENFRIIIDNKNKSNPEDLYDNKNKSNPEDLYDNKNKKHIDDIFLKISSIYKHKDIKKKLLNKDILTYIKKTYSKLIENINLLINNTDEYIKYTVDNSYKLNNNGYYGIRTEYIFETYIKFKNITTDISMDLLYLYTCVVDIFFLRRFLDKDYITVAICYVGMSHLYNNINILIKYFGFKITHISYCTTSVENLTKKIKNNTHNTDFLDARNKGEIMLMILPEYIYQCSDLTKFPDNFN